MGFDAKRSMGTANKGWYELFSRGPRDWLRHNEKIREAVKAHLPEIIAGPDVITRPSDRAIRVPVRFLEHSRFRLRRSEEQVRAGQGAKGQVKPGDVLVRDLGEGRSRGAGSGEGGFQFLLELKIDDIIDWLWEELQLPRLKPKPGTVLAHDEFVREGWDRRGVRSRLDRRRTMKEAIKRRSVQPDGPDFANEDLRFRQLSRRRRPATRAVVFFAMDVSSSMGEEDRKLAKTFFFWALQGLRRQYIQLDTVFIAHTSIAWEFSEERFFHVTAEGGTQASSAFKLVLDVFQSRFDPHRYNGYLFYASDGDNFIADRGPAAAALSELTALMNFIGYVETGSLQKQVLHSETGRLFDSLVRRGLGVGSYPLGGYEDVWPAIKGLFQHQASTDTS